MLSVQLSTPTINRIVKQAIRHKCPFCTDESGAWCELAREPAIYQILRKKTRLSWVCFISNQLGHLSEEVCRERVGEGERKKGFSKKRPCEVSRSKVGDPCAGKEGKDLRSMGGKGEGKAFWLWKKWAEVDERWKISSEEAKGESPLVIVRSQKKETTERKQKKKKEIVREKWEVEKVDSPRNGKLVALPIFFSTEDSEYKFNKEVSTHKKSLKTAEKISLPQPPFLANRFLWWKFSVDQIPRRHRS